MKSKIERLKTILSDNQEGLEIIDIIEKELICYTSRMEFINQLYEEHQENIKKMKLENAVLREALVELKKEKYPCLPT